VNRQRISTAVVLVYKESLGRGPTTARTFITGDVVVCVLEDVETQALATIAASGQADAAREAYGHLQRSMGPKLSMIVEIETGRDVRHHVAGYDPDGQIATHTFLLEADSSLPVTPESGETAHTDDLTP
jgi:uncharacterized protein YbcI